MEFYVFYSQSVNIPEGLVCIIDYNIFQREVLHLAEQFWSINDAVLHCHVVGIPYRRAATYLEIAVGDEAVVNVPPWVLAYETAVVSLDVLTAFYSRLSVCYRYVLQSGVLDTE